MKFTYRVLVASAMILSLAALSFNDADARGRKGSHRVGGYNSHGKGSHYVGGR